MPGTLNDSILQDIAPNVPNLERLYIAGCVKVTERGVWAIISENIHGLLALGMEGLSPSFVRGMLTCPAYRRSTGRTGYGTL